MSLFRGSEVGVLAIVVLDGEARDDPGSVEMTVFDSELRGRRAQSS